MSKTNEGRTTDAEANLARRIASLREERGMSYEALAKAMTAVGCKIQSTAIHKVEKGDKQTGKLRRITVNELAAFAEVFTDGDVAELLKPIELVENEYAQELLETLQRNERNIVRLSSDIFNVCVDLVRIKGGNPEVYDFVMGNWAHNPRGLAPDERADLSDGETLHVQAINRAGHEARWAFLMAMVRAANLWIVATTNDGLTDEEAEDVREALASDKPWIEQAGWLFEPGEVGR